jgi:flavin-dependent dehydrogenase
MDEALAQAAIRAGAQFLPETTAVVGEVADGERIVLLDSRGHSRRAAARIVVAASGLGGRALSGLDDLRSVESARSRIGVEAMLREFPEEYEPGIIFMAVGKRGYVGLTRVEDGRLNVAAAVDAATLREAGGADQACIGILTEAGFPVAPEMARADWHGTIKLTRRTSRRAAERLFLIGDAAGYIEPFTGEGMSWAISSAIGIAPIVHEGVTGWTSRLIDNWERQYHSIIEQRQWVCRALAAGLRQSGLVRAAVPVLSVMPWLAEPVIRHLNQTRPAAIT